MKKSTALIRLGTNACEILEGCESIKSINCRNSLFGCFKERSTEFFWLETDAYEILGVFESITVKIKK